MRAQLERPDATLAIVVPPPRIRPSFELFVDVPAAEALRLVEARIEASEAVRGWVALPYAELRMPERDRFRWSPRLALYAEDAPGGTTLSCRLQPEPDVWTAYVALWAAVIVAGLGVTMYGLSQWVVSGGVPWVMLVGVPVVGVLAGLLYAGAVVGQRSGAAQTWLLERELQAALDGHAPRLIDEPIDDLPRARGFR